MADTPLDPQQAALFREVDDDLRHEQLNRLWKAYGPTVVAAAVALVLAVAGWQGWIAWQTSSRVKEATAFEAALSQGVDTNHEATAQALRDFASGASKGNRDLAVMKAAALLAQAGKVTEATALWKELRDTSNADPIFRDLARLLIVQHGLDQPGADLSALDAELAPLLGPSTRFRYLAGELRGLIALQQNRRDDAVTLFTDLAADRSTPYGIRARLREVLMSLGATVPDAP
ncbi:tetratricopeptide repeat protein [Haematospirillum jordaniae]|uniref:Ancillary SecYEG translocon subunit/Cell division coordinator CpoB TPR domain-containing protein n=1 Tax=Haematospirillum jordaniae TaxID=1549855 RepID=A0A143DBL8_9PROT|nr:tetratricopeptide repeat protein [Haematospirillum jordaniae]AMW33910.1 hypothetical protein AY555_00555 [Haematospirillum jordaniae]NKD44445.1 tetratricopeptide repeat protein [Haematospirillum jordaniae]NKD57465.1 tetratricopeptide repeat protein [Haematospirillum jordaniae]NKD59557.1 tetratricopeptide repeat protein [Haematospirillum jordaniae]NKD67551.1 tetratricopeptide repeat protein [Haematospirillum jordaniae]